MKRKAGDGDRTRDCPQGISDLGLQGINTICSNRIALGETVWMYCYGGQGVIGCLSSRNEAQREIEGGSALQRYSCSLR
jgi:hypothetical protein